MLITTNSYGLFVIALKSSNARDLAHLLDPTVPLVYLEHHSPKERIQWEPVEMPLSVGTPARRFRLRRLSFDLEMPTAEFLASLDDVAGHGMLLLQLHKSLPPNIGGLRALAATDILLRHGLESRFDLPHPGEVATFATKSRDRLEKALENDALRARCIDRE